MDNVKAAARSLLSTPGPTFVVIATLAIAIGANTAIFSVIKTVLLNPLPYPDPERIVVMWEVSPDGNLEQVSVPTYQDWKSSASTIEALAAYRHRPSGAWPASRADPGRAKIVRRIILEWDGSPQHLAREAHTMSAFRDSVVEKFEEDP